MVLIDDILHDIQSDASARLVSLVLEEWLEDALAIILADTHAIIAHADAEVLAIRILATHQLHLILSIFISIGKQVANGLDDSLFVDNGSEMLIGIDDCELFTILLEGGSKTLANRHNQLVDIVRGKVHNQTLLFYLTEVE